MKRGTPRNPKTKALARALNIPIYSAVGILEMLWHFAAEFCIEGDVGRVPDQEIAEAVGWSGEPVELIDALTSTRWLDDFRKIPEFSGTRFRLMVHDWRDHCDEYTKKKLKGLLISEKIPENSRKFSPTMPCPAVPSHAMPEPSHAEPAAAVLPPLPPQLQTKKRRPTDPEFEAWFERVWARHPKKSDRILAEQAASDYWARGLIDAERFEATHALWCDTQAWNEKSGSFAPKLANWITDRAYEYEPPPDRRPLSRMELIAKNLREC